MESAASRLLLTKLKDTEIGALFLSDELVQIFLPGEHGYELGDIFVGKVRTLLSSIQAAFVEFQPGVVGFLPLKELHYEAVLSPCEKRELRCGDEILVQIEKEPVKTKDATLTTDLVFSGEYFVIAPFGRGIRYSKKFSPEEKGRMSDMVSELIPVVFGQLNVFQDKYGLVVRTNAAGASREALQTELHDLFHKAAKTLAISDKRTVFSRIFQPADFYEKTAMNVPKSASLEIVTDQKEAYQALTQRGYANVRLYEDTRISLAALYGLKKEFSEVLNSQVWLKSGGYLVIEPTEALTVIDVNSGKGTAGAKGAGKEEMSLSLNLEAAREIARQIRLRNLSGIIVVDFLNMEKEEHKRRLLTELSTLLNRDPVPVKLVDMTPLGLVEITRKKVSSPLHERVRGLKLF